MVLERIRGGLVLEGVWGWLVLTGVRGLGIRMVVERVLDTVVPVGKANLRQVQLSFQRNDL